MEKTVTFRFKEPLTEDFIDWVTRAVEIFDQKQHDYGCGNIARRGDAGILIRVGDKYERLDNLYGKNLEPAVDDESIDDSWMDMGIYSFMAGMCRAGEWPGFDPKGEDSPEPLPEYGQRWGPVTRRDSEMAEER